MSNQISVSNAESVVDFSLIELLPSGRVSARKLCQFLDLRIGDFARWLDSKIVNNDFAIKNEDYWEFSMIAENPKGGRPSQDFELTSNFAKKLCIFYWLKTVRNYS